MRLEIDELTKALVVRLTGDITSDHFNALKQDLIEHVGRKRYMVLNFQHVEAIDSAGMGMLIAVKNAIREEIGYFKDFLKVTNLSPVVQKCFRIMAFDQLFAIYETEASALASIPKETLLLVDDSRNRLEMLEAMLQFHGFDVITDICCENADQLIADKQVDLIVCGRGVNAVASPQPYLDDLRKMAADAGIPILGLSITHDMENQFSMEKIQAYTATDNFQAFLSRLKQHISQPV